MQSPSHKNVASKSPRTSLTGENTQGAETKTLAIEMQKEEMQAWGGWVCYLKGDSPSVFQTPSRAVIEKTCRLGIPKDSGSP